MKNFFYTAFAVLLLSVSSISCERGTPGLPSPGNSGNKIVGAWKQTGRTIQNGATGAVTDGMRFCTTSNNVTFVSSSTGAANGSYIQNNFTYTAPNCVADAPKSGTWEDTGTFYNFGFTGSAGGGTVRATINFTIDNTVMEMVTNDGPLIVKEKFLRQ